MSLSKKIAALLWALCMISLGAEPVPHTEAPNAPKPRAESPAASSTAYNLVDGHFRTANMALDTLKEGKFDSRAYNHLHELLANRETWYCDIKDEEEGAPVRVKSLRNIHSEALEVFKKMSEKEREAYEGQFQTEGQGKVDAWLMKGGSVSDLSQLAFEYQGTKAGLAALVILGSRYADHGKNFLASIYFQTAAEQDPTFGNFARLARSQAKAHGDIEKTLNKMREKFGGTKVKMGDQEIPFETFEKQTRDTWNQSTVPFETEADRLAVSGTPKEIQEYENAIRFSTDYPPLDIEWPQDFANIDAFTKCLADNKFFPSWKRYLANHRLRDPQNASLAENLGVVENFLREKGTEAQRFVPQLVQIQNDIFHVAAAVDRAQVGKNQRFPLLANNMPFKSLSEQTLSALLAVDPEGRTRATEWKKIFEGKDSEAQAYALNEISVELGFNRMLPMDELAPSLQKVMKSGTWDNQTAAIDDIVLAKDQTKAAVPDLIQKLKESNDLRPIFNFAARLAPRGKPMAWNRLDEMTQQRVIRLESALNVFGSHSKDAVPYLIDDLSDSSDPVREFAATTLTKLSLWAKPAVPKLQEMTLDMGQATSMAAIDALDAIGPGAESAIPLMVTGLNSPNYKVRERSLIALARLKERARTALPELKSFIEGPGPFRIDYDINLKEYAQDIVKDLENPKPLRNGELKKP